MHQETKYIKAADGTLQAVTTTYSTLILSELYTDRDRLISRYTSVREDFEAELARIETAISECTALGIR